MRRQRPRRARLRRDAERREIVPGEPAEDARLDPPNHAVIGEVRERMTECRQLPIEHSDDLRLARVKDHVVEAEVAMHDPRLVVGGHVLGQPGDEAIHGVDVLGARCLVLPAPAG